MKVYGAYPVVKVNTSGMNFLLRACGYPLMPYLARGEWHDACAETEILIDQEEYLEMEYKLKGIRARDLNPIRTYNKEKNIPEYDELYDEYLDYIDDMNHE